MFAKTKKMKSCVLMTVFSAALMCATPLALAAQGDDNDDLEQLQTRLTNEWVMVRNDKIRNIQTFMRQEDGKQYRSFKVKASLDGTVDAAVDILMNTQEFRKWYWEVIESRTLRQVSAAEHYMYMVHRAPAGLPDRDVILHVVVERFADGSNATLRINAVPDYIASKPPLVRMTAEDMTVRLNSLPGKRVQVSVEGYIDPGGRIPAWAINFIQRQAPYKVMVGLARMLNNDAAEVSASKASGQ